MKTVLPRWGPCLKKSKQIKGGLHKVKKKSDPTQLWHVIYPPQSQFENFSCATLRENFIKT